MNSRTRWQLVSAGMVLVLFTVSGYLFDRNNAYARRNRELILQNDSVISVNLDLMNELDRLKKVRRP